MHLIKTQAYEKESMQNVFKKHSSLNECKEYDPNKRKESNNLYY